MADSLTPCGNTEDAASRNKLAAIQ